MKKLSEKERIKATEAAQEKAWFKVSAEVKAKEVYSKARKEAIVVLKAGKEAYRKARAAEARAESVYRKAKKEAAEARAKLNYENL